MANKADKDENPGWLMALRYLIWLLAFLGVIMVVMVIAAPTLVRIWWKRMMLDSKGKEAVDASLDTLADALDA